MDMLEISQNARRAAYKLARAASEQKNAVLESLASRLLAEKNNILTANAQYIEKAKAAGLSEALIDRLALNETRLKAIAADLRSVLLLPDPIGEHFDETVLPNGLKLYKQRVPLGVLGVIYEARPNVTIDIAGLAIKTGNAVILRGGKETYHSNLSLVSVIHSALQESGLPADAVQYIEDPDRARILELLQMDQFVDLIIPRGGASLHQFCRQNSRIPVITGGMGICHLFVDETVDLEAALPVIHNAKTQRPSVCNALDTLLVHRAVAADFLPRVVACLGEAGVSFRVEASALSYLPYGRVSNPPIQLAGPQDFDTEWMSLVLGLKVVEGLEEAIEHINAHSMGHSDGILTSSAANAERFIAEVDSAAVYVKDRKSVV